MAGDGCSVLLLTGAASCIMLIVNGLVVQEVYGWVSMVGPPELRNPRVAQVVSFFLPVLLIFFEWWLLDWLVDLHHIRRRKLEEEEEQTP